MCSIVMYIFPIGIFSFILASSRRHYLAVVANMVYVPVKTMVFQSAHTPGHTFEPLRMD